MVFRTLKWLIIPILNACTHTHTHMHTHMHTHTCTHTHAQSSNLERVMRELERERSYTAELLNEVSDLLSVCLAQKIEVNAYDTSMNHTEYLLLIDKTIIIIIYPFF